LSSDIPIREVNRSLRKINAGDGQSRHLGAALLAEYMAKQERRASRAGAKIQDS